ncbi:MAG: peptide MFS transporter [Flavobacteriales bacterium]
MAAEKRHPKGIYVLFFTEMWERFGYYLMLGIFTMYMANSAGMGFDEEKKSDIYGTYLGLVYLTPFIGGLLADRFLGYRRSIIIGGLLMAIGYFGLSIVGNDTIFYISLLFIIVGNGFFKPNISVLVGNLYNKEQYKDKKDAGYNIFYMGINIGSFFCNFVAAYLRIEYGWGYAFAAAGVGMLIGIIIFIAGTKHIREVDILKPKQPNDWSLARIFSVVFIPVAIFSYLGWIIPDNIFGTDGNDAFLIGSIPVIGFYLTLFFRASDEDKRPVGALLYVFFAVIIFWAVFHQNGDALTVWAKDHTHREIPESVRGVASTLKLEQTVTYDKYAVMPAAQFKASQDSLAAVSESLSKAGKKKEHEEIDLIISNREESRSYFANLPDDQKPAFNGEKKLIPTELFQSVNPFWVICLTPVVVGLFAFLKRRRREIGTPTKIALGLLITGLSAVVMVAAVKSVDMAQDKASAWWLVMSYCVITFGELCLSPMGLSLVSKLSPPRFTALLMGGWFLSTAIGNKLAGMMSHMYESFDDKANFFWMNFGACVGAFLLLFAALRWLNRVMKEKGVN